ncbi:MAG: efflux RND transporter permease subunit [Kofleriaceae bacterium]
MIDLVLAWALRNRFLVVIATILLIVGGVVSVKSLPIDAVPDITNIQVQVLTKSPALGPEQVEKLITTPIEQALGGIPKLEQLRSTSKFGLSVVTVVFDEDTDIYFARQLVGERLQQAREAIPNGLGVPEMGPISTGLGEIYQFELRGDKPAMDLRSILEFDISPRLRAVRGVVEVNPFGGELKTYEVQVNPDQLVSFGVSIGDSVRGARAQQRQRRWRVHRAQRRAVPDSRRRSD